MMIEKALHMNEKKFQEVIAAYGANPARWPESERDGMVLFSQANTQAAHELAGARQLDRLLDLLPDYQPQEMLRIRILSAEQRLRSSAWRWPLDSVWRPAAGMAASLAFGILLGLFVTPRDVPGPAQTAEYDLSVLAFNNGEEEGDLAP